MRGVHNILDGPVSTVNLHFSGWINYPYICNPSLQNMPCMVLFEYVIRNMCLNIEDTCNFLCFSLLFIVDTKHSTSIVACNFFIGQATNI